MNHKVKCIGAVGILMMGISLLMAPTSAFAQSDEIISAEELIEQLKVKETNLGRPRSFGAQVMHTSGSNSGSLEGGSASMTAIQFELNSDVLTSKGLRQTEQLAKAINGLGSENFKIVGHTDASGDEGYNLDLSQRRANTVVSQLVNVHGVAQNRISAIGLGEKKLANAQRPNASENRRVEAIDARRFK